MIKVTGPPARPRGVPSLPSPNLEARVGLARPLQVLAGSVGPPQVGERRNGVQLGCWRVYAVLVVPSAMAWHCIVYPSLLHYAPVQQ